MGWVQGIKELWKPGCHKRSGHRGPSARSAPTARSGQLPWTYRGPSARSGPLPWTYRGPSARSGPHPYTLHGRHTQETKLLLYWVPKREITYPTLQMDKKNRKPSVFSTFYKGFGVWVVSRNCGSLDATISLATVKKWALFFPTSSMRGWLSESVELS